ncbi:hypothetical protein HPB49_017081 [Dermacentor silvarum]|uniref:Uncharacterized protein n=1 Tax=Dermacentor silvarum TaxID=543639 RepID=A0ACB8CLX1_DERSI|nr:hypothetical protein HPB49_017081 [Dermacentor silvarum]
MRREYLAYGAMGVVAIMFAMDMMSAFLCQAISAIVGVLGSLRALERQDPMALQKWTSYWLIYIFLNVYFGWVVRFIGRYFIKIYMFKFLLLAWCALPTESNGSDYLYNKLLAHKLFRPMGAGSSAKKAASPPLQPPSGDERRDKVRASRGGRGSIMRLCVLLSLGLLATVLAENDEATTEETIEKRLLVFPANELQSPGGYCQSPLGVSGRCVPYQECRFLFEDEFLARRSLCGFAQHCGVANSALVRIVGGKESNLGAWPWINLKDLVSALISPDVTRVVLRARRHCCSSTCTATASALRCAAVRSSHPDTCSRPRTAPSAATGRSLRTRFVARLGEHDYLSNDDGASPVDEPVVRIERHEQFNPRTYLNDVAVLTLRRPVPLNKDIALVCLPYGSLRDDQYESRSANIAGWGELYYGGPSSASLQDTRIPIQTLDTCKESFKRTSITFTDHYLCAGSLKGDKDACRGDSGGPLMLLDEKQRFTIIGITSFGRRCAEPGYPGVYARVAKYLDWIQERLV